MSYPYRKIRLKDGSTIDEHRLIMQKRLGRKLQRTEVVHHINRNKFDNSIDNLKLMTLAEHSAMHAIAKETGTASGKKQIRKHPSQSAYKHGCRCDCCKSIERERRRNQRARGIKT